jgi:hypothetical protein
MPKFRRTFYLHLQGEVEWCDALVSLKMEAVWSSETFLSYCSITHLYNSEDLDWKFLINL